MARKRHLESIEVRTTVESSFYYGKTSKDKVDARRKELLREAKNLKEQIERHCDYSGTVSIEEIYDETCEFCGAVWTERHDTDNGGCCNEDVQEAEGLGI